MRLFAPNKQHEVQSFTLKLINNNCPELEALMEGPRLEGRVNLAVVVLVVPLKNKKPIVDKTFAAVTKGFSTTGVSLVLQEPRALDEVFLGFRWEGAMKFVRAKAKHLDPLGAGFYDLGFQMKEMICVGDYPELQDVSF